MPTSLLSADTKFPNFSGSETTEEKVDQITNYLYMLVEQLRYSMANIGAENFNETEFDNIVNLITEPVYLQLKNETGEINTSIQLTEKDLSARISGISDLLGETQQTTTELTASLSGITASVSDLSGKYTSLQSTVNGLTLTSSDNGNTSTITLSANGTAITSANIKLTGEVTFAQAQELANTAYTNATQQAALGLSTFKNGLATSNYTTINGGNIRTGIIQGVTYYSEGSGYDGSVDDGSFVVTADNYSRVIGGIKYQYKPDDGMYADKLYLYTTNSRGMLPSIKLYSVGNISLDADAGQIYMNAFTPTINVKSGGQFAIYVRTPAELGLGETVTTWQFIGSALYKNGVQVL